MAVILVDLDDTLIPDVEARDAVLADVIGGLGSAFAPDDALQLMRFAWRACPAKSASPMCGVSSWEAMWTDLAGCRLTPEMRLAGEAFQDAVWQRLLPDVAPTVAAERYRRGRAAAVIPYAWVPDRLDVLGGTDRLWCVTNGSGWLQRHKLALAGLTDHFDRLVIAGEVGAVKAAPEYAEHLRATLAEVGDRPAYVIGDRTDSDGALASALGIPFRQVVPGRPF